MQPNQTVELQITDIGMNGEGIAHSDGMTFFVPYALPGELVRAKITFIKKKLAFADLKEVLNKSEERVTPPCNRFERCGGCAYLHLAYSAQLRYKRAALANTLRKAGIVAEVDEVVPSVPELNYRNKVQLPFGTVNGKVAVGFFREGTHKIVSVTKCFLHADWLDKLISVVLSFAEEQGLTAYDDATGVGLLRHLVARYICQKLCVTLVINAEVMPSAPILAEKLNAEFGDVCLYLSPNMRRTNVIMGERVIPVSVHRQELEISGVKLTLHPFSFFQINDYIRDKIYSAIVTAMGDLNGRTVIDAYGGVGLLGVICAKHGARVYNVEIVPEAVADGKLIAQENGVADRVTFVCGDCAQELEKLILSLKTAFSGTETPAIVIDPPRKGISPEVAEALNRCATATALDLFYISCNQATLARDLSLLSPSYEVRSVTPYDMFPSTPHIETLVSLVKKS